MNLSMSEKMLIKNLLEDRINEHHELFLDLTAIPNASKLTNSVSGVVNIISRDVALLAKITNDIEIKSMYDADWLTAIINSHKKWSASVTSTDNLKSWPGRIFSSFSRFFNMCCVFCRIY